MTANTFYWYDYETFGIHPALDRPAQFAGVRTDADLNPVGEELLVYNQLTDDYLPDPGAALVTGIGPASIREHGLAERDFISRIKQELSQPGTCNVGYNSIRFDDEFTRFTLFRNFHDPYEHEWRDGNSRWDLLDIVRLTRALRPEGIEWPFHPDGSASNRLEDLTRANGLSHSQAHDALSDVHATINVARLIRQHQPRLFDFAFNNRGKAPVATALNVRDKQAVLHVSGMIPGQYGHTALVMPVAQHPDNKNGIIVLDLRDDPAELNSLGPADIARRIFTPASELPEGEKRLGIKTIHINRAPVIAPLSTLDDVSAERLQIDKEKSLLHRDKVAKMTDLPDRIAGAMQSSQHPAVSNVDASLYSGGFFSAADKKRFARVRDSNCSQLGEMNEIYDDNRIDEMLFRYRGRNCPDHLSEHEKSRWAEHCIDSLTAAGTGEESRVESYIRQLSAEDWPADKETLREELLDYGRELTAKWSIPVRW